MGIILTETPNELSTMVATVSYFDEDSNAVTPNTAVWSLYDKDGNIVNSRSNVSLVPGTSNEILLYGDDLNITTNGTERKIIVSITYDSSLGNDLPLKEEIYFSIVDLYNCT